MGGGGAFKRPPPPSRRWKIQRPSRARVNSEPYLEGQQYLFMYILVSLRLSRRARPHADATDSAHVP